MLRYDDPYQRGSCRCVSIREVDVHFLSIHIRIRARRVRRSVIEHGKREQSFASLYYNSYSNFIIIIISEMYIYIYIKLIYFVRRKADRMLARASMCERNRRRTIERIVCVHTRARVSTYVNICMSTCVNITYVWLYNSACTNGSIGTRQTNQTNCCNCIFY